MRYFQRRNRAIAEDLSKKTVSEGISAFFQRVAQLIDLILDGLKAVEIGR